MLRRWYWNWIGGPLFRASFHNWYGVRRTLLRLAGANVSASFRVRPSVRILSPWNLIAGSETAVGDRALLDCSHGVTLGDFVTISQYAALWSSDAPGAAAGPIRVGNDGWVSTDAFVYPGVEVGEGAILGARSVAATSLEPWTIYGGEPAKPLKKREKPVELR